ncbi:hypothetical protein F4679DRAFT_558372 [Xylaria curta]|nr:hypothetical protein F4679DRAFT_558372 [Xylaria curta]
MAFEMPDPALYQSPPSLQPKRPVAAEAVPNADGTSPSAQPITMAGRVGSPPSAVASSRVAASGKVIPASVPASAMRTGPVPLSQVQKRTFADDSDSANREPGTPRPTPPPQGAKAPPIPHFPTLQVRIPGHPATFPVQEPEFPCDKKKLWEELEEDELLWQERRKKQAEKNKTS